MLRKRIEVCFSVPVCVFLAWFIVADRQESLKVSELWSLDSADASCCGRWFM
jgi:hypothetical protein